MWQKEAIYFNIPYPEKTEGSGNTWRINLRIMEQLLEGLSRVSFSDKT